MTEDEMVGWCHQLDGHEFEQVLRVGDKTGRPWTVARQSSLSFTISQSLFKLMSIESVMPSNHLILWSPPFPPALSLS